MDNDDAVSPDLLDRVLGLLLPARHREAVLGDLIEERGRGRSDGLAGFGSALGIATRLWLEPWRALGVQLRAVGFVFFAFGLTLVIAAASDPAFADPALWPDPVSRWTARLWALPHVVNAIAVGLLVGRVPIFAEDAQAVAVQVAFLSAGLVAWAAPDPRASLVAATTLLAAAWLGHRTRVATSIPQVDSPTGGTRSGC